jgi:hypothetical protein
MIKRFIRHFLRALALVCVIAAAQSAAQDSDDRWNMACVVRLDVPGYPNIARGARIVGTAMAEIELGESGSIRRVDVTGVKQILREAVEQSLRTSVYSPNCKNRQVRVMFHFVIFGDPAERPRTRVSFSPPNLFTISTEPAMPTP